MLDCPPVTTLEEAEAPLASTIFPVTGLRRDAEGNLTTDAIRTITDGLKSRGVDPMDPESKQTILVQTYKLLCSTNQQYQFLVRDLFQRVGRDEAIPKKRLEMILEKNQFMQDVLSFSRHLEAGAVHRGEDVFLEGWQSGGGATATPPGPTAAALQNQRRMLQSKSLVELKKHMLDVTEQKNRVASNYLGVYGFLNLVAVGLLIYVASASSGPSGT